MLYFKPEFRPILPANRSGVLPVRVLVPKNKIRLQKIPVQVPLAVAHQAAGNQKLMLDRRVVQIAGSNGGYLFHLIQNGIPVHEHPVRRPPRALIVHQVDMEKLQQIRLVLGVIVGQFYNGRMDQVGKIIMFILLNKIFQGQIYD